MRVAQYFLIDKSELDRLSEDNNEFKTLKAAFNAAKEVENLYEPVVVKVMKEKQAVVQTTEVVNA